MPTLTDEIKTFIVKGLARFETPSELAAAVKSTFDVEVTPQQVRGYDPAGAHPPAERWLVLHSATRRAFLDDVGAIGIASRTARLRMLDRLVHRAEAKGNLGLAASLLKQAARECGGMYKRADYFLPSELAPGQSAGEPATPSTLTGGLPNAQSRSSLAER